MDELQQLKMENAWLRDSLEALNRQYRELWTLVQDESGHLQEIARDYKPPATVRDKQTGQIAMLVGFRQTREETVPVHPDVQTLHDYHDSIRSSASYEFTELTRDVSH